MAKKVLTCLALTMMCSFLVGGHRVRESAPVELPGVDRLGFVDFANEGTGIAKVTANLRTGRVHGVARGTVPNLSRRLAVFRNDPELLAELENLAAGAGFDVEVRRGVYRVTKRGRARAVAVGSLIN